MNDDIERRRWDDAAAETMRREKSAAVALDSWFQREEGRKKKVIEEIKAREREAITACKNRVPEAPDLRWIGYSIPRRSNR